MRDFLLLDAVRRVHGSLGDRCATRCHLPDIFPHRQYGAESARHFREGHPAYASDSGAVPSWSVDPDHDEEGRICGLDVRVSVGSSRVEFCVAGLRVLAFR